MEIFNELHNTYGFLAILGIAIGMMLVWFAAHIISENGQKVRVLWGLVEYTKKPIAALPSNITRKTEIISTDQSSINKSDAQVIKAESSDRAYIISGFDVISKDLHGMTNHQKTKYCQEHYYGKWMRVCGPINDLSNDGSPFFKPQVFIGQFPRIASFQLDESEFQKISHLRKNAFITIEGIISRISDDIGIFSFNNGRIIETSSQS